MPFLRRQSCCVQRLFLFLYSPCGAATLRVAVALAFAGGDRFFACEKSAPHNIRLNSLIFTPIINRTPNRRPLVPVAAIFIRRAVLVFLSDLLSSQKNKKNFQKPLDK